MMKKPTARLLKPPKQNQSPLTRAEAECKLAEVLGQGNRDLYAQYVRKRTKVLSLSNIRLLAYKFTQGEQYEFEKTFERLFGGRDLLMGNGRRKPRLYDRDPSDFDA